ncbi:ribosomal-processing cysteine protease Prp [Trichococcus ilyis]|jgi:uncharacterized protein YsxB (DUF464 family)|uniref:Ribosomal processing cysteine protease Prp n=1 Tax=Trichococcus ilyis TaxID=640938 RepID=A0A143YZN0_9LACT|nr:ribosomal-processing cysteine protease Prp [Trichococcus ilyis]CZR01436.1 Hypothetical protein TR210_1810 [Trichococcus ilyis]SEJ24804.1 hypothetical protein SAMN05216375_1108 [Trichococcus ilyis]
MIEVKFREDDYGNLISFEVTGHAGYGVHGEDIICAAVSVLAIETVNSVERLAGYQMLVDEADAKGGYLYAEIRTDTEAEQQYITQILLKHLFYSLEDVAQTYPDYVSIKMQ